MVEKKSEEKTIEDEGIIREEFVQDFDLSGELVSALKDKHFEITDAYYTMLPDFKNPEEKVKKMTLKVKLVTGQILIYHPNKTAQKSIMSVRGPRLPDWIGYNGEFEAIEQNIAGKKQKVIFIK